MIQVSAKLKRIPQDTGLRQNTGSKMTANFINVVQTHYPHVPLVWGKIKETLQLLENSNRTKGFSGIKNISTVDDKERISVEC